MVWVNMFFQVHIKLIKIDSEDIYNTKYYFYQKIHKINKHNFFQYL